MTSRDYLEDQDAEEPDDFIISLTSQVSIHMCAYILRQIERDDLISCLLLGNSFVHLEFVFFFFFFNSFSSSTMFEGK